MQEFPKGVRSGAEETAYQEWIREHPRGLILNKAGKTYTLHSASCSTMSYNLAAKSQDERPPKFCFSDLSEYHSWNSAPADFDRQAVRRCGRCDVPVGGEASPS